MTDSRSRPPASRRTLAAAGLVVIAGTLAAIAWNRAIGLRRALAALVDGTASSVGDPLPSVVAAERLGAAWQAPVYDDCSSVGSSFVYPPIAALPYTLVVSDDAAAVHAGLVWMSRIAFVLCLLCVYVLAGANVRRRSVVVAFVAWSGLTFFPLLRAVQLNQASLLVAVCIGASACLVARGKVAAAGAVCALAAAFKPQLAVVPLLAAACSRPFARSALVTLAVALLASLVYGGIHNHWRYLSVVLPQLAEGYAFYPNQSWSAFFLRLGGASPLEFELATAAPWVGTASLLAAGAMVVAGAFVLLRSARRPAASEQLSLAVLFAWQVATLASPISWEHHYVPALFVLAWLLGEALVGRASRTTILCAAFAAPAIAGFVDVRGWSHGPVAVIGSSYVLWGGLLLAIASSTHLLRRPTAE